MFKKEHKLNDKLKQKKDDQALQEDVKNLIEEIKHVKLINKEIKIVCSSKENEIFQVDSIKKRGKERREFCLENLKHMLKEM